MKRRAFLISTGGAASGLVFLPRLALAEDGRIDWYTSSDQNITRLLDQHRRPRPSRLPIRASRSTWSMRATTPAAIAIAERALAALQSEQPIRRPTSSSSYDPRLPTGGPSKPDSSST